MKLSRGCIFIILIRSLLLLSGSIVRASDDDSDILAEIMAEAAADAAAKAEMMAKLDNDLVEDLKEEIVETEDTVETEIPEATTDEKIDSPEAKIDVEKEEVEVETPKVEIPEQVDPEPAEVEVDSAVKETVAFGFSSIVERGNDLIESLKNNGPAKKLVAGSLGIFGLTKVAGWTAAKGNAVDAVVANKK